MVARTASALATTSTIERWSACGGAASVVSMREAAFGFGPEVATTINCPIKHFQLRTEPVP